MWGGRFSKATNELLEDLNASIKYDYRLAKYDIEVSIAHVMMLAKSGVISKEECQLIVNGLKKVQKEISDGKFEFKKKLEDIHMNIESRLTEIIGPIAGKLHTARSRNDQVATDIRLFLIDKINGLVELIEENQKTLSQQALDNFDAIMPGYTHLQIAQPITLGHHLLSYVELFNRDKLRLTDSLKRLDESPLGAAAMAGTSYPVDREYSAKLLGFNKPMSNSIDAVSSRDMLLETLSNIAILSVNLSRLAEEIILWVSTEFNFISLPDSLTTGSSIMPQKKNPDPLEFLRGKTGSIFGNLFSMLTILKGLPLSYFKDLQDDKEIVFRSYDTLYSCISILDEILNNFKPNKNKMLSLANKGFVTATDLADYLVKNNNKTFREAYQITAQIVNYAERRKLKLDELKLNDLKKVEPKLKSNVLNIFNLKNSIKSKKSFGGTSFNNVKKMITKYKKIYK